MSEPAPLPDRAASFRRLPRESVWSDLLVRSAAGDQQSFASLYDETSSLVYSLAMRMLSNVEDAEEVTLDVYNQAWRLAKTFDPSRGTVTAWLMTMARTRALDKLRARSSRQKNIDPMPEHYDAPSAGDSPEDQSATAEQRRIVLAALNQLPADQRRALELAYFQGMSHAELAAALGEPLGTVKTRIRLGMMKLRELLTLAADPARSYS
ncbi:MAG: sigma-70 family RNA polymerase sigma factor [Bryobacterales bacterium]|nr:sigma-70 family RNA polymerase sigma factor [Bryobacterales bacterium]